MLQLYTRKIRIHTKSQCVPNEDERDVRDAMKNVGSKLKMSKLVMMDV